MYVEHMPTALHHSDVNNWIVQLGFTVLGGFSPAAPPTPWRSFMAAMAASAAGQGGLVVLLNIRPFSESQGGRAEWLQYLREELRQRGGSSRP